VRTFVPRYGEVDGLSARMLVSKFHCMWWVVVRGFLSIFCHGPKLEVFNVLVFALKYFLAC
jgi:hypothetical protein